MTRGTRRGYVRSFQGELRAIVIESRCDSEPRLIMAIVAGTATATCRELSVVNIGMAGCAVARHRG
jgi:hypothetical protein